MINETSLLDTHNLPSFEGKLIKCFRPLLMAATIDIAEFSIWNGWERDRNNNPSKTEEELLSEAVLKFKSILRVPGHSLSIIGIVSGSPFLLLDGHESLNQWLPTAPMHCLKVLYGEHLGYVFAPARSCSLFV